MSFVVQIPLHVTRRLDQADTSTRQSFLQIVELLEEDPFPDPQFPFIRSWNSLAGYPIFLYADGVFPFVVEYRVFSLDATTGGMVRIVNIVLREDVPPAALADA